MKRFIDSLQIWLYLTGFTTLARLVGKLGTVPQLVASNEDDRITLPAPAPPTDPSRSGPGWSLDEFETGPIKIINFDPTFNGNQGIDPSRDVAFPHSKLDVN